MSIHFFNKINLLYKIIIYILNNNNKTKILD